MKQRPFDWHALIDDMAKKKLGEAWASKYNIITKLSFDAGDKGDFGLLRPSIEYLEVDEQESKLTLHGLFGKRLNNGVKVTVNNKELYIKEWSDSGDLIVCTNLAKSGTGSIGPVVVTINGLKSNEVPLTGWRGTFTYTIYKPGGSDMNSVIGKITYKAFLRGDIHKSRKRPGELPKCNYIVFSMVQDMDNRAEYTSEGCYEDEEYTLSWSGSGVIPPGDNPDGGGVQIFGWWGPCWYPYPKLFVNMYSPGNPGTGVIISIYDKKYGKIGDFTFPILTNSLLDQNIEVLQSKVIWDPNYDIPGKSIFSPIALGILSNEKIFSAELKWEDMAAECPPTTETEG